MPDTSPDSAGSRHGQHAHLASAARKCNPVHPSANAEMNHYVQVLQLTGVRAAPTSALSASSQKHAPPLLLSAEHELALLATVAVARGHNRNAVGRNLQALVTGGETGGHNCDERRLHIETPANR